MQAYETSPQQRAIWRRAEQSGVARAAQAIVTVPAELTAAELTDALRDVAGRHEILRTSLHRMDGVVLPVQRIADQVDVTVHEHRSAGTHPLAQRRMAETGTGAAVPVVADLVRADDEHAFLLTIAPDLADGATMTLLVQALAHRCATGAVAPGRPDDLQYVDAADWQHEMLTAPDGATGRAFWTAAVAAGAEGGAGLPFVAAGARPGPADRRTVPLDARTVTGLRSLATELDVPVGDVVLTAWRLLLTRLAGGPVPCAVTDANRRFAELESVAGPLAIGLPVVLDGLDGGADRRAVRDAVRATSAHLDDQRARVEFCEPAAAEQLALAFAWDRSRPLPAGWRWRALVVPAGPAAVTLAGLDHGDGLSVTVQHDTARCDGRDVERLVTMLRTVLAGVATDPGADCARLAVDPTPPAVSDRPRATDPRLLPELVTARAVADPDAVAVACADGTTTYRELHDRARRIAHRLRALGVGAESVVAVELPRGRELVATLLGVLYAGAAYLPLEPGLPPARRARLLTAAAPACVVGEPTATGPDGRLVLRPADIGPTDPLADPAPVAPDQLAYVLFTSGSTGEPKGVCVPHRAVAAYAHSLRDRLADWQVTGPSSWAVVSSFAADLGLTSVWGALGSGGTLHVAGPQDAVVPARLARLMAGGAAGRVQCLKIVPSHLRALLSSPEADRLLPSRLLVLGGEATDRDLLDRVRALAPTLRVVNHYGPTETTVGVLTHELCPAADAAPRRVVPALGRPLAHADVHVVDGRLRPTATWQPGEILIGGSSLARGYLGAPGATADLFRPDPDPRRPGARRYRTGDAGARDIDGTITFLGRIDDQLNLNGHRIEPAEIVAVLRECSGVDDAAVLAQDGQLTAYVAHAAAPDSAAVLAAARHRAATHLPEALRPTRWAAVRELPRTPNGKLDREALAAVASRRGTGDPAAGTGEPPRPGVETTLAAIWTEVLDLRDRPVGRHDNFFAVGGDSILSIQVIGRAAHAGIALSPTSMFRHQTIAELAAAEPSDAPVPAEQGPVHGSFVPTPVQQWFLDQEVPNPAHYNQALLLEPTTPLAPAALRRALGRVIGHHDGLRLRVSDGGPTRTAVLEHADDDDRCVPLTVVDLHGVDDRHRGSVVERLATTLQQAGDLRRGPVLRATYLRGGAAAGADDRLLLVAHHLGIDGVSWRIVLDDLATAYAADPGHGGGGAPLPRKTTSYLAYAERLAETAAGAAADGELAHWSDVPAATPAPVAPGRTGAARHHAVTLDETVTSALLELEGRAGTSTLDALLAALAHAVAGTPWAPGPTLVVDLEHHGRDHTWDDVDLTRTVGWFTTIHPLALRTGADPVSTCARVRRDRLAVPDHGRNWMLWRHHRATPAPLRSRLQARPRPAIRVNYLGRFRTGARDGALLTPVDGPVGPTVDPAAVRPYALDVTAVCTRDRMTITWTHPAGIDVAALAAAHVGHLRAIASADDDLDRADWAAQADLDDDELDGLLAQLDGIGVPEERS